MLKSDQEPILLNLLQAVKNERAEDIEVLLEKSHIGEPRSNVEVKNDVQDVRRQVRTMKMALASRYDLMVRSRKTYCLD